MAGLVVSTHHPRRRNASPRVNQRRWPTASAAEGGLKQISANDPKQTIIPAKSGRPKAAYGATFKPSAANTTEPL